MDVRNRENSNILNNHSMCSFPIKNTETELNTTCYGIYLLFML